MSEITTVEQLEALDPNAILIASGTYPGERGTFSQCHVRRISESITGGGTALFEVLVFGDSWPQNVVRASDIKLPAIVLHPTPQPSTEPIPTGGNIMSNIDSSKWHNAKVDALAAVEKAFDLLLPVAESGNAWEVHCEFKVNIFESDIAANISDKLKADVYADSRLPDEGNDE